MSSRAGNSTTIPRQVWMFKKPVAVSSFTASPQRNWGGHALFGRSFDYLSFYASAGRLLTGTADRQRHFGADDRPAPPLNPCSGRGARRRRSRVINWLQDIYPEIATECGVPFMKGPVSGVLASARNASLHKANVNVVVGDRMSETLSNHGVPSDLTTVIPNWCDDELIVPVKSESNPLRAEWDLQNKFVVGYSGNLGRAQRV